MPQTIEARRTAPSTRKSVRKGNNKERQGRKECNRTEAVASKVIASSLFALKPKPMVGIQVIEKQSPIFHTSSCGEEDFYKMYCDLLEALQYAIYEIKGEKTTFDPYKSGLDFATSFTFVMNAFENNILPEGFNYNIDKDKDGYYFTLFSTCEFEEHWHPFEIKPIVEYLERKKNEGLTKLFFTVLNTFRETTGMWSWFAGGMAYAESMMEDFALDNRYDLDEEEEFIQHASASELLLSYKSGYIHSIGNEIQKSGVEHAMKLMSQLAGFDQSDEVVSWMHKILEFLLETPGNIRDYVYFEDNDEDMMQLQFVQMVTLIWDWDDEFTHYEMESIDDEANNDGIRSPHYNFMVKKGFDTKFYKSREELKQWPMLLHKLWDYHTDVIVSIIKKNDECKN